MQNKKYETLSQMDTKMKKELLNSEIPYVRIRSEIVSSEVKMQVQRQNNLELRKRDLKGPFSCGKGGLKTAEALDKHLTVCPRVVHTCTCCPRWC